MSEVNQTPKKVGRKTKEEKAMLEAANPTPTFNVSLLVEQVINHHYTVPVKAKTSEEAEAIVNNNLSKYLPKISIKQLENAVVCHKQTQHNIEVIGSFDNEKYDAAPETYESTEV